VNKTNIPARVEPVQGRPELTAERLLEILDYAPDTGIFTWRPRPGKRLWNSSHAGKPAGQLSERGYIRIEIGGKRYRAHRLAHLWMVGKWPGSSIDHVDRNRADNRWSKLRPATPSQQIANQEPSRRNKSGVRGVYFDKERAVWRSIIEVDGRERYLGRFKDFEDAVSARKAAEEKFFGVFACHPRMAADLGAAA
jgi:HNH endonuclease